MSHLDLYSVLYSKLRRYAKSHEMPSLTPIELKRYARHLTLPEVGVEGQLRIKQARVLIVGAGGLGSPIALYLAAAGVGTIGIIEFDRVDETNLQRQILYGSADVGESKLERARNRLSELNPWIALVEHAGPLTAQNALEIISQYDLVLDGSDNFSCRYIANDACFFVGKPLVSGSILGFEGQLSVFNYQKGPCYRCLYPDPPPSGSAPNCTEAGVLGVLPGVVGTLQATEALKIILEIGEVASGRLIHYDALSLQLTPFVFEKNPTCPLCGQHPTITTLEEPMTFCTTNQELRDITVEELAKRLQEVLLVDVREPHEREICAISEGIHIPLRELQTRLNELPRDKEIILYCHMGGRSGRAVHFLREQGFQRVRNLKGGIIAWANEIDPSMEQY